MNFPTFTVQTVHGLQETFQVGPNGTIDTTCNLGVLATQSAQSPEPRRDSQTVVAQSDRVSRIRTK